MLCYVLSCACLSRVCCFQCLSVQGRLQYLQDTLLFYFSGGCYTLTTRIDLHISQVHGGNSAPQNLARDKKVWVICFYLKKFYFCKNLLRNLSSRLTMLEISLNMHMNAWEKDHLRDIGVPFLLNNIYCFPLL